MAGATSDVWEVMSTARTIRRFTEQPVDDATLARCLQAAMWAPSGANAQAWRFIVLRSAEQRAAVAKAASRFVGPIPVLSALPGQFLLKDVVLMGVAIWTLGEALQAHRSVLALDADRDQVGDGPG